jgi:hypothetical protein
MHQLTLTQKTDDIFYIGVIDQAQDVVVGCAGLLFWYGCA